MNPGWRLQHTAPETTPATATEPALGRQGSKATKEVETRPGSSTRGCQPSSFGQTSGHSPIGLGRKGAWLFISAKTGKRTEEPLPGPLAGRTRPQEGTHNKVNVSSVRAQEKQPHSGVNGSLTLQRK